MALMEGKQRSDKKDPRQDIAERIAAGLSGWLQNLAALDISGLAGEDSAKIEIVKILSASGYCTPKLSQKPKNWDDTQKRIDIALLPRYSEDDSKWYGAIELKWPKENTYATSIQKEIVIDIMRLCSIETQSLNAKLFVIGGKINKNQKKKDGFLIANNTKITALNEKNFTIDQSTIEEFTQSSEFLRRILKFNDRKIDGKMIALGESYVGGNPVGRVEVWLIQWVRGRRKRQNEAAK